MNTQITEAELLQALRDAEVNGQASPDGFYSRGELMELTGWDRIKTLGVLQRLNRANRLEVLNVKRVAINGRALPVPVYRVKV